MTPDVRELRAHVRSRTITAVALAALAAVFGIVGWEIDPVQAALDAGRWVVGLAQRAPGLLDMLDAFARWITPAFVYLPNIFFFALLFAVWLLIGDILQDRRHLRRLSRSGDAQPPANVRNFHR